MEAKQVHLYAAAPYNMRLQNHPDHESLVLVNSTEESNEEGKALNGAIFCDNVRIAPPLPVCIDIQDPICLDLEHGEWGVHHMYDGVLLRIYKACGEWIVSTSRCIDARKARWASPKSFHTLYLSALQGAGGGMNVELDENMVYTVIMVHPEHTNIIQASVPRLYLAETYDRKRQRYVTDASVPSCFTPLSVDLTSDPFDVKRGIMWTHRLPNGDIELYKEDFLWFREASALRMNEREMSVAYVQQWPAKRSRFYALFPWAYHLFNNWDDLIISMNHLIFDLYKEIYLGFQPVKGGLEEKRRADLLHQLHPFLITLRRKTRGRRITLVDVQEVTQGYPCIPYIIRALAVRNILRE